MKGKIIVFEGNIAACKTTVSEKIQEYFPLNRTKLYKEPLNNDLMEGYYKNPKKYAFATQLMLQSTQISRMEMSVLNKNRGYSTIIDRGCMGNHVFVWKKLLESSIDQADYKIYNSIFAKDAFDLYEEVDHTIFLWSSPKRIMERILSRGRKSELLIDINYISEISNLYLAMMLQVAAKYPGKVYFINWDKEGDICDIIEKIKHKPSKVEITEIPSVADYSFLRNDLAPFGPIHCVKNVEDKDRQMKLLEKLFKNEPVKVFI